MRGELDQGGLRREGGEHTLEELLVRVRVRVRVRVLGC